MSSTESLKNLKRNFAPSKERLTYIPFFVSLDCTYLKQEENSISAANHLL